MGLTRAVTYLHFLIKVNFLLKQSNMQNLKILLF